MRLPVWNNPRIIGCAENHPRHIGLPRGCLDALLSLPRANNIQAEIQDERISGQFLSVQFTGILREDQQDAIEKMLAQERCNTGFPRAWQTGHGTMPVYRL